jgi:NHS family nucleoside permease-like MFS transporter
MASGKVVEMYTVNGITDWQSVWLIFAAYSLVLAVAFVGLFKYKHERVAPGAVPVAH